MLGLAPLSLSLPGHFIFIIARPAAISPEKQMRLSCHLGTCFGSHRFLPLTRLHTSRCHKSCIQGKVFAFPLYCQATLETQCFKIHFNQSSSSLHKRVNKYLSVLCWNVKHDPLEVLTTYCLCQNLCHWKLLHDSSTSTHCIGRVECEKRNHIKDRICFLFFKNPTQINSLKVCQPKASS